MSQMKPSDATTTPESSVWFSSARHSAPSRMAAVPAKHAVVPHSVTRNQIDWSHSCGCASMYSIVLRSSGMFGSVISLLLTRIPVRKLETPQARNANDPAQLKQLGPSALAHGPQARRRVLRVRGYVPGDTQVLRGPAFGAGLALQVGHTVAFAGTLLVIAPRLRTIPRVLVVGSLRPERDDAFGSPPRGQPLALGPVSSVLFLVRLVTPRDTQFAFAAGYADPATTVIVLAVAHRPARTAFSH